LLSKLSDENIDFLFLPFRPLLVLSPTSYPYPEFVGQKTNEGEAHFRQPQGERK
jgi:hypothetical protein